MLITIWTIKPTLTAWFLNIHTKSTILHRFYRVKVKLIYKSEGLERLFLQLIIKMLTNLYNFPPTELPWNIEIPLLFIPLTRISENFPPLISLVWSLCFPFTKGEGIEETIKSWVKVTSVYFYYIRSSNTWFFSNIQ